MKIKEKGEGVRTGKVKKKKSTGKKEDRFEMEVRKGMGMKEKGEIIYEW